MIYDIMLDIHMTALEFFHHQRYQSIAEKETVAMLDTITWLGHSSVKIKSTKTIYIDPWNITDAEPADLVCISHSHYDHCSPGDVEKIRKDSTVIVTTADCAGNFEGDIRVVRPGDVIEPDHITVDAVSSYNTNKSFHPRENNWVGFIITVEGTRIYYCGDTDFIPEMKDIAADLVIAPVGGTYTMTAEEAAQAVNMIRPKLAIPIHYGDIVGSIDDAKTFKDLCDSTVEIIPPRHR